MFLLTLTWLVAAFRDLSRKEREDITLSYDNICHLDNLKFAKKPLPLPGIIANYELYVYIHLLHSSLIRSSIFKVT